MIAQFFALIQLILAALSLWEGFLDWMDANYRKRLDEKRQARDQAAEAVRNSTSEEEFDKASDALHDNMP